MLTKHSFTVADPTSAVGKKMEEALHKMRERLPGRRHEAILGPIGRFTGGQLARLAAWFDPAAC